MAASDRQVPQDESLRLHIHIFHVVTVRTQSGPVLAGGGGGGLVHYVRLAQEWVRLGHSVTVFTNLPEAFEGKCSQVVTVGQGNPHPSHSDAGSLLQPFKTLMSGLMTSPTTVPLTARVPKNCVAIAASPNFADIAMASRFTRGSGVPVIVACHHIPAGPWWFPSRRGGVVRCVGAWLLTQTGLLTTKVRGFVPSIDQLRILSESGWRFSGPVLPDEAFLDRLPSSTATSSRIRPVDACFVSRLSPAKGIFDLLKIWSLVHRLLPTARLEVGGDFESKAVERKVNEALDKMGLLGSVTLRGHLSAEAKQELLATARLFPYPSYEEGWSLAVMEAAAYGCIPVVYDLPAYDYLGPALPRVRPGHLVAFAAQIADLLIRPDERDKLATSLRTIPQTYTAERIAREQVNFFRSLLGEQETDLGGDS